MREKPTPSEGVNRQLPKPPVCASSMFGDNGSGRRLRAKHHESYRWPQLRADLKYSFINGTVSPFVALRGGMIIGTSYKGLGGYLRPSAGVDVWRFSLTLSYELMGNPHRKSYTNLSGATATESWRSNANNFNVGIAFRF